MTSIRGHVARMAAAVLAAMLVFAFGFWMPVHPASADDDTSKIRITTNADSGDDGDDQSGAMRDKQGVVSQLNVDSSNPYKGLISVKIDIGSEFAEFDGSDVSEGLIVKCNPGDYLQLPVLRAREGYVFVGWGQGGVPDEPTWDPMITTVQMSDDTSSGRTTTINALFADMEGNGYCTCGAYKKGIYAGKMDQISAAYDDYLATIASDSVFQQVKSGGELSAALPVALIGASVVMLLGVAVFLLSRRLTAGTKVRRALDASAAGESPGTPREGGGSPAYEAHPSMRPAVDFMAAIEAASKASRD